VPLAGKTGTSGEYKDRWFAGITPYYCAVVWTGFDTPERISVNGNPAAQLWRKVMSRVHDGLPWADFTYPYLGANTGIFGYNEYGGQFSEYDAYPDDGTGNVVGYDDGYGPAYDDGGNTGSITDYGPGYGYDSGSDPGPGTATIIFG